MASIEHQEQETDNSASDDSNDISRNIDLINEEAKQE